MPMYDPDRSPDIFPDYKAIQHGWLNSGQEDRYWASIGMGWLLFLGMIVLFNFKMQWVIGLVVMGIIFGFLYLYRKLDQQAALRKYQKSLSKPQRKLTKGEQDEVVQNLERRVKRRAKQGGPLSDEDKMYKHAYEALKASEPKN